MILLLWALAFFAVLVTFVWLFIGDFTRDAFYETRFKGPPSRPLVGHAFRMRTDDMCECNKQHKADVATYGSPVMYKFLHQYMFHISSPDHFEAILKHSSNIAKPLFYRALYPWLRTGLLTSESDKWHQRRKLLTPTFHFQILREFIPMINEHADGLVRYLKRRLEANESVIDMMPVITLSALDIICETAMGRTTNALESKSPYATALLELGESVMKRTYSLWLFVADSLYLTLALEGRRTRRALDVMHAFTRETIKEREKELPSKEELYNGRRRLAFLDLLLDLKRDGKLTDADIAEETDTFMFEGHDTTATALMWFVLAIGTYRDHQKRCQEEIDEVFSVNSDSSAEGITSDQLAQLNYLERCIKESQRMFPSVPLIGRRVDQEMQLDEKLTLKPGATVQMNILCLHRHPQYWEQPDKFDPDRFLADNVAKRHPFAFVPFSAGPRNCIGQKFAMTEMKLLMAHLLRHFSWETVDDLEAMHGSLELVLRPEIGAKIRLSLREI